MNRISRVQLLEAHVAPFEPGKAKERKITLAYGFGSEKSDNEATLRAVGTVDTWKVVLQSIEVREAKSVSLGVVSLADQLESIATALREAEEQGYFKSLILS